MGFIFEERASDSPYLETVTQGRSVGNGSTIRPSEVHWHMVLTRQDGDAQFLVVGPWTSAGVVHYTDGAEILWIKFKLGTFMPHLPTRDFLDTETALPEASSQSFWLDGSTWQFPDFENVETFVERLVRDGALAYDPTATTALQDQLPEMSSRTVRHRFLRSTGLTQSHISQYERAQQAATLLRQGTSILDTVHDVGYYDQPHLTRALKQFVGYTPGQLLEAQTIRASQT